MGWWDAFKRKPRDGAVGGIPLLNTDQLALVIRNRTTQSTQIVVRATIYDPATDKTRTVPVTAPFITAGTVFALETTQFSAGGEFGDGEVLVAVTVTAGTITNPTQLWVAVALFRSGSVAAWLCDGYVSDSHLPSWRTGSANFSQLVMANPATDGALYTFQGTLLNDGATAGNHVLTVNAAAGSRVELISLRVLNSDASARTLTAVIDDGANVLDDLQPTTGVALAAATSAMMPIAGATVPAATSTQRSPARGVFIAGANRLLATLAAVAVSQDSAWALVLKVWGEAPTIALTGPAGVTATTNTSRFEPG